MPSSDLWQQAPLLGIIVLVLGVLYAGLERFFIRYSAWQDRRETSQMEFNREMATLRECEQAKRDGLWREFLAMQQAAQNRIMESMVADMRSLGDGVRSLAEKTAEHNEMSRHFMAESRAARGETVLPGQKERTRPRTGDREKND